LGAGEIICGSFTAQLINSSEERSTEIIKARREQLNLMKIPPDFLIIYRDKVNILNSLPIGQYFTVIFFLTDGNSIPLFSVRRQ